MGRLDWIDATASPKTSVKQPQPLVFRRIQWCAEPFRWWRESEPAAACGGRAACERCHDRACSCAMLRPARGVLPHAATDTIRYDVNAPEGEGCVATLVRVRREQGAGGGAGGGGGGGGGGGARAALVAYRVLAPRLVLRLLSCALTASHHDADCGCRLDGGAAGGARGTATLRPRRALTVGRRTCYRLRLTNVTPLPTAVHFDSHSGDTDEVRAMFCPRECRVPPYGEVEIRVTSVHVNIMFATHCSCMYSGVRVVPQVVLEARRVCGRRVFVFRGRVLRALAPLYLLVDAAVAVSTTHTLTHLQSYDTHIISQFLCYTSSHYGALASRDVTSPREEWPRELLPCWGQRRAACAA
ncbi:unnamed protein product [Spodoptera exigua]|nr:unnamed protein product [Spodoptera exigua]